MRLPRTFIIATVIALTALATIGFGNLLGDSGLREDISARQNIVLTAMTADVTPLRHDSLALGPIPCPDGSTVDFGQFCPLPTIQCANGTSVPIGQFCPLGPTPAAKQAPPPLVTCPDGSTAPSSQACQERGATGESPGVACPDGSVVPAGQQCPPPKPTPQSPVVVTVNPPTKSAGPINPGPGLGPPAL
jgi:hypothetical protein